MAQSEHRNRLAGESSPYLLQHAGNPVDWHPWGEEAIARARAENKPLFVSIGYAACHWCHVMEHESFADHEVAAVLNAHFVPVKVDREERPDVDAVYMEAVQAMSGQGGWPLNVFVTPALRPFFGGTYFPPDRRWGRPSFREVLEAVHAAWRDRRAELESGADDLLARLAAPRLEGGGEVDLDRAARAALQHLAAQADQRHGGFGEAPKFPTPSRLFFLLERAAGGDELAEALLGQTLDGMAAGGMADWLGGGFHRYSVDERWLVPHFEKMLYDNALLARAYGEAGARLGVERWTAVARATADYLLREMQGAEGGFYSSTDADSDGEEGRFFTWTADEVRAAVPAAQAEALVTLLGLDGEPSFEGGRSVLRPTMSEAELADRLALDAEAAAALLAEARAGLLAARARRSPPALDDKRLAGWNGMAVWALAWLGAALADRRYLRAAQRSGGFLRERLTSGGRIERSWREGVSSGVETLEDVAWVSAGWVELYEADGDTDWLRLALEVVDGRLGHYLDGSGRLLDTPDDGEALPLRPRSPHDGATPAQAAVLAATLLRLGVLTGRDDLVAAARAAVRGEAALLHHASYAATSLLQAAIDLARPPRELVLVGDPGDAATVGMAQAARAARRRPTVLAPAPRVPVPAEVVERVPLFAGRTEAEAPLAHLCSGGACRLPIGDPAELARALDAPP